MALNKREQEVQQANLDAEKLLLKQLQACYRKAQADCVKRIEELAGRSDLENLQSIVFQVQYQKAIMQQITGILDTLQSTQFKSVADYLTTSYENGWVGAFYDLQGQGIPLIIPINQEQVVQAIQNDAKLSKPYYDRLGEDVAFLKKAVKAQVSRGIANGSSWFQVAQELHNKMTNPFGNALYNAMRIARTEGHRVQQQSQWNAITEAKKAGCEIVKQWDSTLDGRTRSTHARLDGQIREIDEYFEVDGKKALYPGAFGRPEEDIHCRCCCAQRAKWALDEDELKILQDRADFFGLDKTADFEEFKQKFNIAVTKTQLPTGNPNGNLALGYGQDFYSEIRQRVADCPDDAAVRFWDAYEDSVKVGDPNYKGRAYEQAGRIYVDKKVAEQGVSYQKPYQVVFHECGHAIDFFARKLGSGNGFFYSYTYENGKFPATIKSEVAAWVSRLDKQMKADFKAHATDYEWLHEHHMMGEWEYSWWKSQGKLYTQPTYSKSYAYAAVEREIRDIPMLSRGDLSDIVEGATKGRVQAGIGHGKSYWNKSEENLATEAFAEMMDSTFANPESLEIIKKYLPDSYQVFQDMLSALP